MIFGRVFCGKYGVLAYPRVAPFPTSLKLYRLLSYRSICGECEIRCVSPALLILEWLVLPASDLSYSKWEKVDFLHVV